MNKTTETNDICALTADETLVVSGGQVVNPAPYIAQGAAAEALIEGIVNVFKSLFPPLTPTPAGLTVENPGCRPRKVLRSRHTWLLRWPQQTIAFSTDDLRKYRTAWQRRSGNRHYGTLIRARLRHHGRPRSRRYTSARWIGTSPRPRTTLPVRRNSSNG
jgi:hypothetical protein